MESDDDDNVMIDQTASTDDADDEFDADDVIMSITPYAQHLTDARDIAKKKNTIEQNDIDNEAKHMGIESPIMEVY